MHVCIFSGTVKKCGLLKIVHEKIKHSKKTEGIFQEFVGEFEEAIEYNKDVEPLLRKTQVC